MKIRGNSEMMTCMKSYAVICENLECNPSEEAKEALAVLAQFKTIFESADTAMQTPVLQEICRSLPVLHFGGQYPLDTKPVDTIRREYRKRTGTDLSPYFCSIAYHNIREADAKTRRNTGILDADNEQEKCFRRRGKTAEESCCREGN